MRDRTVKPPEVGDYAVLMCPSTELNLEHTLASGQAFRWKKDREGWWSAVIGPEPSLLRCWQDREQLFYQTYPQRYDLAVMQRYFQLDVDLAVVSENWRRVGGEEIRSAVDYFAGLRVTRQDPTECLFSFLCSSVAPIYRIRRMIETMSHTLGVPCGEVGATEHFAFPLTEYLADASESLYTKMGIGFRGKNIRGSAAEVLSRGGPAYLCGLANLTFAEARAELMTLPGVGAKIADCVCLFALGKHEAVPLDVHMLRVAKRLFAKARAARSLTARVYDEIQGLFIDRFGPHAGWAQQYLFYNELRLTGAWDEEMATHVAPTKRLFRD